jgi:amino acid permease
MSGEEQLLTVNDIDSYDAAPKKKEAKSRGTASLASSIVNLTNTIVGSGTLAMAFTCQQSGYVVFLLLMGAMAFLSHYAIVLIFKTVQLMRFKAGETITYGLLGKRLYGRFGELVAEWAVTLQQLGACIGYVVIIGDIMSPITQLAETAAPVFKGEWLVQLLIVMLIIFPLCLLRNMDSLKFTSLVALLCILAAALAVAVYGFDVDLHSDPFNASEVPGGKDPKSCGELHAAPRDLTVLSALPVFSFAFLCHQNTFPIYEELRDPTVRRMSTISAVSMALAVLAYVLAGLGGYFAFAEGTRGDIFLNFEVLPGNASSTAHSGPNGPDGGCMAGGVMSYIFDVVRVGFGISLIFSCVRACVRA